VFLEPYCEWLLNDDFFLGDVYSMTCCEDIKLIL